MTKTSDDPGGSVAAWLSEKVLRGRGPDASGFESHRRGRIFSKEGTSAGPWMKNQHSFGHHREVSTGSSPVGKGISDSNVYTNETDKRQMILMMMMMTLRNNRKLFKRNSRIHKL
ncbi:hypothetical protein GEV33_007220 [Tenebrio molitor]|uniref:Uncharacterized protein n=1 Tax=Tenebrio molitor TaxID=7067 RepID=A0A8J6LCC6_TENMO|nr:hypothetical protein GEV33_007220 [Tenebrio molitor]